MIENNVKKYRHAAGLTLAQLVEASGIPISTLADIEHGAEPRVITAICLSKALNASVEQLWPISFPNSGKP